LTTREIEFTLIVSSTSIIAEDLNYSHSSSKESLPAQAENPRRVDAFTTGGGASREELEPW